MLLSAVRHATLCACASPFGESPAALAARARLHRTGVPHPAPQTDACQQQGRMYTRSDNKGAPSMGKDRRCALVRGPQVATPLLQAHASKLPLVSEA